MSETLALGLHYQLLKRAGSLIHSLDELRNSLTGVAELAFPQIIVVGEESVGKSSVLERIAMLKFFPRNKQMCTRLPIKLQLKHKSATDMEQFCRENNAQYSEGVAFVRARMEFDKAAPSGWSSFLPVDKVEQLVSDTMQQAVQARNSKLVGVIEDVLVVEVTSNRVPNLTLIDLPGTCVVARPGEPENIKECTQSLVEKYLQQAHTLVLIVVPAGRPLHNYLPMELVKKHRKLGHAIGVFTKTDLAANNRFAGDPYRDFKQQLRGVSEDYVPLEKGYVAVRNRDTEGTDTKTLEDAAKTEVAWFEENLPLEKGDNLASSPVLVEKLVDMMCSYVENTWAAHAKRTINAQTAAVDKALHLLGPIHTAEDLGLIMQDIRRGFTLGSDLVQSTFEEAARQAVRGLCSSSMVGQGQLYAYRAGKFKQQLLQTGAKVLEEAAYVSGPVKALLNMAKRDDPKLARFACLFDTLAVVISDRFQGASRSAVERYERKLSTVFCLFDSDPSLQRPQETTVSTFTKPRVRLRMAR